MDHIESQNILFRDMKNNPSGKRNDKHFCSETHFLGIKPTALCSFAGGQSSIQCGTYRTRRVGRAQAPEELTVLSPSFFTFRHHAFALCRWVGSEFAGLINSQTKTQLGLQEIQTESKMTLDSLCIYYLSQYHLISSHILGNIWAWCIPSMLGQERLWSQVHRQLNFTFQGEGKCFTFLRLSVRWKG